MSTADDGGRSAFGGPVARPPVLPPVLPAAPARPSFAPGPGLPPAPRPPGLPPPPPRPPDLGGSRTEATPGPEAVDLPDRPSALQRALKFEITAKKVKPLELMHFCRYMSVFLTAGIPILDALDTVYTDTKDKRLRQMIGDMSAALRAGDNFSTAIAVHARALPNFFVHMVRAAEETGQLSGVLAQLGDYIERDSEAKRKTRSALIYPAIVVGMSLVSVSVLIGFVLPRFVKFFDQFHAQLPLATRMLVSVSKFVQHYGAYIGIGVLLVIVTVVIAVLSESGKRTRDTVLFNAPLVRGVVRFAVVERFCRILASMVQAGVPLPTALDLASKGATNRYFGGKISLARQEMIAGAGLSGPLASTGLFPSAAIQMIRVGEETGTLEERLDEVSTFYGKELQHKLKRLTDLLEPISVVIVGVLVGFVAIAIISAIYGVYNSTTLK